MPLITLPFANGSSSYTVRSGDAAGMRALLERLFTAQPAGTFLVDCQFSGAGAGASWLATLIFSDDPIQSTPVAPVASLLVRAVVAGDAPQLEAEISRVGIELSNAGAVWAAKLVQAGAGAGAAWMAIVFGSTSPRPVPTSGAAPVHFFHSDGTVIPVPGGNTVLPGVAFSSTTGRIFYQIRTWGLPTSGTVPPVGVFQAQLSGRVNGAVDVFSAMLQQYSDLATPPIDGGIALITFGVLTVPVGPVTVDLDLSVTPSIVGDFYAVSLYAALAYDVL